jgi:hypothetical protein
MRKILLLCAISALAYLPTTAQNMASIEIPSGIALVYGLDYHPKWYTQLKPTVGFGWVNSSLFGKTNVVQYAFIVEQRYYYNIIKRSTKGKNTRHKSANFFSVKPAWVFSRTKYDNNNPIIQLAGKNRYDEQRFWCSVNWGLRRAMGKRFYFDGSIGLGPGYSNYDKEWDAIIDLNLGIGFKLF